MPAVVVASPSCTPTATSYTAVNHAANTQPAFLTIDSANSKLSISGSTPSYINDYTIDVTYTVYLGPGNTIPKTVTEQFTLHFKNDYCTEMLVFDTPGPSIATVSYTSGTTAIERQFSAPTWTPGGNCSSTI